MSSGDFSLVRDLLARRAYKDAHALCMKAIRSDPNRGEPYFLLGILAADHANVRRVDTAQRTQTDIQIT